MSHFVLRFALAAVAAASVVSEAGAGTPSPVPAEVLEWVAPAVERQRPNPLSLNPEAVKKGRGLFIAHCAVCHGPQGRGDGPAARPHARKAAPPRDLTRSEVQARLTDGEIRWKVVSGLRWQGRIIMPAFGEEIPNEENRWRLILFVRTLASGAGAAESVGGTLYADDGAAALAGTSPGTASEASAPLRVPSMPVAAHESTGGGAPFLGNDGVAERPHSLP